MPTINCPFCMQTYDVDLETIGQKVQCAVCNETFIAQIQKEYSQKEEQQYHPDPVNKSAKHVQESKEEKTSHQKQKKTS